jgi:hypothetical protein
MGLDVSAEAYLNECMNGFEYQVAAHMIAEGMVEQGLAVVRVIDQRYAPAKRNPWNEVECGDHYSRSMASFGAFLTMCGFDYHGPSQSLGLDPRLRPEDFRCAVLLAEGWGSYAQSFGPARFEATLTLEYGRASLRRLHLHPRWPDGPVTARVDAAGASHRLEGRCAAGRVDIELPEAAVLDAHGPATLRVTVEAAAASTARH